MKNKNTKQQTIIEYEAPRPINIGDVFYVIDRNGGCFTFYEPCKVCNDTHILTINGETFACPCCYNTNETISVNSYVVHRVRVYAIYQETQTSSWKACDSRDTTIAVYRKEGRGDYSWNNNFIREYSPRDFDRLNKIYSDFDSCDFLFDDYKKAVETADMLTAKELERLQQYNAKHGTAYVAEFKTVHDKKSN